MAIAVNLGHMKERKKNKKKQTTTNPKGYIWENNLGNLHSGVFPGK